MRTIEEVTEWLRQMYNKGDGWKMDALTVLEFINSDPPCDHPTRWHLSLGVNNSARYYNFCPDCGEKLPKMEKQ